MAEESAHTPAPVDRAAMSRGVADDMAAIFGPTLRASDALPPAAPATRSRGRQVGLAAIVIVGVAGAIGAGVLAGGSAIGTPATDVASPTRHATAPSPSHIAVAGPAEIATGTDASLPAPTVAPAPAPAPSGWSTALPPIDRSIPLPSAAVKAAPAPAPAPMAAAVAAPPTDGQATPRQAVCDDEDSCVDARLDTAERDLADAYARASDAGVRARVLRGYRNEWLRARDEADRQPHEALRLYAMMTADLRNLGDDAAATARREWQ